MAALVDDIVDTACHPNIAVLVAVAAVAGEVERGILREIRLEVTLVISITETSRQRKG
jgi:hypothetical protein